MLKFLFPMFFSLLVFSGGKWVLVMSFFSFFFFGSIFFCYSSMLSLNFVSSLFCVDSAGSSLFLLTIWIISMMMLCSWKVEHSNMYTNIFLVLLFLLTLTLTLAFTVNSFLIFYMLFEFSLVPTLLLVLGWGYQPERLQASSYLMMYTMTASLPMLVSMLYMYVELGSFYMYFSLNFSMVGGFSGGMNKLWWAFMLIAFLVKMPMYITHLWLPKAHVEAPVSGSMFLAGVLLKLGGYGLFRIGFLCPAMNQYFVGMLVSLSLWGACLCSFICIRQVDLKSLVAYSSVGHMGLVISGVFTGHWMGLVGSLAMMISHGLISSGLFCIVNMSYEMNSTRSVFLTKGVLSVLPSMSFFFFLLSVMNMGAPPSINLFSEIYLLTSILSVSIFSSIMLGVSSFLAAAYSLYFYVSTQHGPFGTYNNTFCGLSLRMFLGLFLHLFPALGLILCVQYISLWV